MAMHLIITILKISVASRVNFIREYGSLVVVVVVPVPVAQGSVVVDVLVSASVTVVDVGVS